jgi:murein DD-endopeptidase MepM/ murein hydrolase activator NlpD
MHLTLVIALARACYLPPVGAPIVEAFVAPPCEYCAGGHRGLEYDTAPGTTVRAIAPGVVSFSGAVAGVRYVVVDQDDGLKATYGMLAGSSLAEGARVAARDAVGRTGARFYFGMRRGESYLDPEPFLAVVLHRPRLVPSSGLPPRPARPRPPSCPAG